MVQMRTTWAARESVDRDGDLTDSLLDHCHHYSWAPFSQSPSTTLFQMGWEVRGPLVLGRGQALCWGWGKFVGPREVPSDVGIDQSGAL